MGFRAKGFHEKSSETGTDQPRKRYKDEDDSDHDSEDDLTRSTIRPLATENMLGRVTEFNAPFLPGLAPLAAGGPMMALPVMHSMGMRMSAGPLAPLSVPNFSAFSQDLKMVQVDDNFSFLETAAALLNRFCVTGTDAWGTVLSIARMLLVSKGWSKPPTMDDASRILREVSERYPGSHVLVIDPTTRHQKDRIMIMSPSAQVYLGPVSKTHGGLDHRIILNNDAWPALTAAFGAYNNPGAEFGASLNVVCKDSTIRPAVCSFSMFPNERVLVIRAAIQ